MRLFGCTRWLSVPLIAVISICALIVLPHRETLASDTDRMAECAAIENDSARLKCYDKLSGRAPGKPSASPVTSAAATPPTAEPAKAEKVGDGSPPAEQSVIARHWDLDKENRSSGFVIRPYRSNYLLPLAYNNSPNMDASLDLDPDARPQKAEAKFQISFKVKLWEDVLGKDMDLWFAYTQLAFWQVYNKQFSSPFRETDYEPELLLNFRTDYDLLGLKGRMINIGLNHQSNGRSQPLSRSWNRVVANFGFERDRFNLLARAWYRIPENEKDDDNPDIDKYMGYGELWGFYYWKKQRFAVMLRNNLRPSDNRGAVQLEWSFPLVRHINGYIQYFNGYGESLIDYNKSVNRLGIGFMLTDW